jgi:sulfur-carrier protein adenylyltransferase/sulfurtransferase
MMTKSKTNSIAPDEKARPAPSRPARLGKGSGFMKIFVVQGMLTSMAAYNEAGMTRQVINIFPDELEEFRSKTRERNYLLIDVRQPGEFAEGHIPGAQLIPLPEIEKRAAELDGEKNLILYCRTGGRSAVAAALIKDAGQRDGMLYNLVGGITGWEGKGLKDIPHLELFPRDMALNQTLYRAMNMEKGAWLFYNDLSREYAGTELGDMVKDLSGKEEVHARSIFTYWKKNSPAPSTDSFEDTFERLDGRIMEGGKPISAWMARLGKDPEDRMLRLLELACEIEYYAYDLYRGLAKRDRDAEAAQTYLLLAEQEKAHVRVITKALDRFFGE